MIITLTNSKINKNNINNVHTLTFIGQEMLMILSKCGMFFNQYRECRINFDSVEYIILCPILYINNKKVILHPAIKLPRRRYPCYVYLYAVIRYINSDLNMRQVAKLIRRKFGLGKFSAATVCRSVNQFIKINDQINNKINHIDNHIDKVEQMKLNYHISFCKKLTYEIAYQLLSSFRAALNDPISFTNGLVYRFFCMTGKFLF